mmetsp:Transcript_17457/g.21312  ORF Transcript_17457/g.21312 Transcript_17457/m.21312 type:complete len:456 (+) Transcript_17457:102-1469(+)
MVGSSIIREENSNSFSHKEPFPFSSPLSLQSFANPLQSTEKKSKRRFREWDALDADQSLVVHSISPAVDDDDIHCHHFLSHQKKYRYDDDRTNNGYYSLISPPEIPEDRSYNRHHHQGMAITCDTAQHSTNVISQTSDCEMDLDDDDFSQSVKQLEFQNETLSSPKARHVNSNHSQSKLEWWKPPKQSSQGHQMQSKMQQQLPWGSSSSNAINTCKAPSTSNATTCHICESPAVALTTSSCSNISGMLLYSQGSQDSKLRNGTSQHHRQEQERNKKQQQNGNYTKLKCQTKKVQNYSGSPLRKQKNSLLKYFHSASKVTTSTCNLSSSTKANTSQINATNDLVSTTATTNNQTLLYCSEKGSTSMCDSRTSTKTLLHHDDNQRQVLLSNCAYCDRLACTSCIASCENCNGSFCKFCYTIDYNGPMERMFCLDCHQLIGISCNSGSGNCELMMDIS